MTRPPLSPQARHILQQSAMLAASLRGYHKHYILWKLRLDPMYALLADQSHPLGRILDVGCGQAIVSLLASARGDASAYTGVDLDESKLRAAKKLLASLPVRNKTDWQVLHLKLPDDKLPAGPFDTVMLLDVLHYWPIETQATILQMIRSVMPDHSVLYLREGLASPTGRTGLVGLGERFTTALGLNPRVKKLHFQTSSQMESLLDRAGFVVTQKTPAGGVNELWVCSVRPAPASQE